MNKATTLGLCTLALSFGTLGGCEGSKPAAPSTPQKAPAANSPAATPSTPTTPPTAASGAAAPVVAMGVKIPVPNGWRQVPPANSMRLAEIQVPDASGDAMKACTIAFSTAGGSVQSNFERWFGQIRDAAGNPVKSEIATSQVAGLTVSTVEMVGVYAGMGDGAPKPDWMLRGSIVETSTGLLFIKMTGPAEQMKAASASYKSMLDGLTK